MTLAETLLPEFDQELTTTRKLLERIPQDKAGWRPHAKSWTLGELSLHIANLVSWTTITLETTELDLSPPGGAPFVPPTYASPAATLAAFDANRDQARAALAAASDEDMGVVWSLKNAGEVTLAMPRAACLRFFILNHLIHHRGQLTVYLRQCDVALPSVYGPTADEAH